MKNIDITGKRFGRLLAVEQTYTKKGQQYWMCICDCGTEKIIRKSHLISGRIKSCGCLLKDNMSGYKHGLCNTRIMRIFQGIKNRCYNKNEKAYKNYGGRNITICKEWLENSLLFYEWAKNNGYKKGLTIDRIDNNKGYSPDNCRWTTYKQQARNTRRNLILEYRGKKKCLAEWCDFLGLDSRRTQERLKRGWSVERAFSNKEALVYWSRRSL